MYLVELVFPFFGIVDGRRVAVLSEVACCYEAVAACERWVTFVSSERSAVDAMFLTVVTWSTYDKDILARADGVDSPDYM